MATAATMPTTMPAMAPPDSPPPSEDGAAVGSLVAPAVDCESDGSVVVVVVGFDSDAEVVVVMDADVVVAEVVELSAVVDDCMESLFVKSASTTSKADISPLESFAQIGHERPMTLPLQSSSAYIRMHTPASLGSQLKCSPPAWSISLQALVP